MKTIDANANIPNSYDRLIQPVGQRSTGYSEPENRRAGDFKVPDSPFTRLAVSHRGGKSGQEATRPNRKSFLPNNIRLRTLLATRFSKWPGGHEEGGQPRPAADTSSQPRPTPAEQNFPTTPGGR